MKKIMSLLSALVISVVSFTGISNAADSKKPIVIPTHNWSSQIVMAYVIGGIFESMGNNVKYVNADSQAVYDTISIRNCKFKRKQSKKFHKRHFKWKR
jgi:glycine betaine/proline transport system substrate-binding protein